MTLSTLSLRNYLQIIRRRKMSFQSKWKNLNPERQCQIFHEYNSHFPIEIRFAFADWIDSKPWYYCKY